MGYIAKATSDPESRFCELKSGSLALQAFQELIGNFSKMPFSTLI